MDIMSLISPQKHFNFVCIAVACSEHVKNKSNMATRWSKIQDGRQNIKMFAIFSRNAIYQLFQHRFHLNLVYLCLILFVYMLHVQNIQKVIPIWQACGPKSKMAAKISKLYIYFFQNVLYQLCQHNFFLDPIYQFLHVQNMQKSNPIWPPGGPKSKMAAKISTF